MPAAQRGLREPGVPASVWRSGRRAVGLQFHLETTPPAAAALVENCRDELVAGPYVQSESELLAAPAARYAAINRVMEKVLGYLLG